MALQPPTGPQPLPGHPVRLQEKEKSSGPIFHPAIEPIPVFIAGNSGFCQNVTLQ